MFGLQMILPSAPAPASISGIAPRNLRLPPSPPAGGTSFTLKAPLFTPSRTFDADVAISTAGGNADNGIILLGVSGVRSKKRAYFKFANGEVRSAVVGSSVKGWLFTALGPNSARLSRDGQTITLEAGVAQAPSPSGPNEEVAAEEEVQ